MTPVSNPFARARAQHPGRGVHEDTLTSQWRHAVAQDNEQVRRPLEVVKPLTRVGLLGRDDVSNAGRVGVMQLAQEPTQPQRDSWSGRAAQERPTGES